MQLRPFFRLLLPLLLSSSTTGASIYHCPRFSLFMLFIHLHFKSCAAAMSSDILYESKCILPLQETFLLMTSVSCTPARSCAYVFSFPLSFLVHVVALFLWCVFLFPKWRRIVPSLWSLSLKCSAFALF